VWKKSYAELKKNILRLFEKTFSNSSKYKKFTGLYKIIKKRYN